MKATGIFRRVDDLGRVVIPKEIRRTLSIHEGDPLEIFQYEDCVCFKKYSANKFEKVSDELSGSRCHRAARHHHDHR